MILLCISITEMFSGAKNFFHAIQLQNNVLLVPQEVLFSFKSKNFFLCSKKIILVT